MERGAPRRRLECRGEEIVDVDRDSPVSVADLVDLVRGGGRFVAVDAQTGKDVTLVVLARMLGSAIPAMTQRLEF
jgi:hypothetical protein